VRKGPQRLSTQEQYDQPFFFLQKTYLSSITQTKENIFKQLNTIFILPMSLLDFNFSL
jgi:hypothetical protein